MTEITRRGVLIGLALGIALPNAGCAGTDPAALSMACGEPGGIYIRFGELLRTVLQDRGAATLSLKPTNGSAENLSLLADGSVDLAIALADSAEHREEEASGRGGAEAGFVALGRVYQNYLQCIVRRDGPVRALDDLAGRRVSIGAAGSGSSFTTRRLFAATGRDTGTSAPIATEHPLSEALDLLVAGEIDACFWSGGIPTPEIADLSRTVPLALIDLADALPKLSATHPDRYLLARVPVGVYGAAMPIQTVGIPNLLLARPELPASLAQAVVDALVEDARQLVPQSSVGLQFLTQANLIDTGTLPLHPAAARRYRERYG